MNREDVLILALPRGGVPVAFEGSTGAHAPRDIFLVRKLGVPGEEQLAMGAISTGGVLESALVLTQVVNASPFGLAFSSSRSRLNP